MPLKVTFELSDADLEYFRSAFHKAQASAKKRDEADILHAARRQAREMRARKLPQFVEDRIHSLDSLTRMLEDDEWKLGGPHRARVLQALAYFAEPARPDPRPDPRASASSTTPSWWSCVVQELRPEIDAYEAFCQYRNEQRAEKVERRRAAQAPRGATPRDVCAHGPPARAAHASRRLRSRSSARRFSRARRSPARLPWLRSSPRPSPAALLPFAFAAAGRAGTSGSSRRRRGPSCSFEAARKARSASS